MRRWTGRAALCLALSGPAVLLSTPAASWAQAVTAAQREAFAEAQKLYDSGDFAGALPRFEALSKETDSPNARLYVARCLRELGKTAEAYDHMAETVRYSTEKAASDSKYSPTRDAAAAELALLAAKVGHLVIAVADAPEGSSVTLDGTSVDAAKVGTPLTVIPGNHVVELSGQGFDAVRREVEVKAGESRTLTLLAKSSPVTSEPKPPPPDEKKTSGGELRIFGIVCAALGGAGLATFAATGTMASSKFTTLEEECGGARCTDPTYADVIDEGKTLELVANITLGVGAAFAAASIPLIIWGGPSETSTTAALSPTPGGAALSVSGTF
jgi:hypothetical protein